MNYRLFQSESEYIFSIFYGGAALQILNIELTAPEKASYQSQGQTYLDSLEVDIRNDLSQFKGRHVEINFDDLDIAY